MSASFLVQNYRRQPLAFLRGQGCWLEDAAGRRYLDAFAGVAVCALGHGDAGLAEAIARQARSVLHVSNHYQIAGQEELAARLAAALGGDDWRLLFCNSGAEANECALKVARLWCNQVHGGRKPRLLACEGSFHGRTLGALALTHTPAYRTPFAPLAPVEFVPFGDAEALARVLADDCAAFFVEPIQGESGVKPAPTGYLERARELCDRYACLLICDEVQTGMARTGRAFGFQHHGIRPDIATLAKGLGGGVPIGAAAMSRRLAELLAPGTHGTTFGGNPLACAAGLEVAQRLFAPGFIEQVAATGARLMAGLTQLFGPDAVEVRGRGLLIGVQLHQDPAPLIRACAEEGLIVGPAGGNTLRFAPPLILGEAEVAEILVRLGKARARL